MSLAVNLNSENRVIECIEIPDSEDNNAYAFVNFILNKPGRWMSASSYEERTGNRATVGCIYIPNKDIFVYEQPFDDWILDENYVWIPPVSNDLRNMNFGYENEISSGPSFIWHQEKKRWGHYGIPEFIINDNNRKNGVLFISKAIINSAFNNASDYVYGMNVVCLPKSYKYIDVHPDWEPGYTYPIYRETFGKKYGITKDNPDLFYSHKNYAIIFDGAPFFFIHHSNLCDLNKKISPTKSHHLVHNIYEISEELEYEYLHQYPYISARNMGELFRLIIDWDILFHKYENRENTAITCHNILGSINLPENIYNDVYNHSNPSLAYRKHVCGETEPLLGEVIETPGSLLVWLAEKYWDLRYLKHHNNTNLVDVNENHYLL